MTLQEFQNQALQLSIGDRWRLVQSLLNSIQQETLSLSHPNPSGNLVAGLDFWTQSLLGVIQLSTEDPTESYIDLFRGKIRLRRVLFDSDVLLDVLAQRQPFVIASVKALNMVTRSQVIGYVSGHAVTNIYYILRRQVGSKAAR